MSGDFNNDFNFDFFKEVYEGTASADLSVTANASGVHGVTGTGAATVHLTASAVGVYGDVEGTGAATVEVIASGAGTHSSGVVPLPIGIGGFVRRVPQRKRREKKKRIPAVIGVGNATILLTAHGEGRHEAPNAVVGNAGVLFEVRARVDATFIDMVALDNDDLMMLLHAA